MAEARGSTKSKEDYVNKSEYRLIESESVALNMIAKNVYCAIGPNNGN